MTFCVRLIDDECQVDHNNANPDHTRSLDNLIFHGIVPSLFGCAIALIRDRN